MNYKDIIVFDFETTGINPYTCQPIQLAAVCIDGRKLEIKQDTLFNTYIRPEFDKDVCQKLRLDMMNDAITQKTGITVETLQSAPSAKMAWSQFSNMYMNVINPSKDKWKAPIKAGFNIIRYDNIIIDRLTGGHNRHVRNQIDYYCKGGIIELKKNKVEEPYGFGPYDDERGEETLFAPRDCIDLLNIVWQWTEDLDEINSLSLDSIREWLGISKEGAHNAVKDVFDTAEILIRFMNKTREFAHKISFKNSFKRKRMYAEPTL